MNYSVIRNEARKSLSGKWGTIVGAYLIYSLIIGATEGLSYFAIGGLALLLLLGPMNYGFHYMTLRIARNKNTEFQDLFEGFNHFINSFYAGLLIDLFIFLWALLFVIPGIIASYSYSMTYYIMMDNPNLSANEAITKSKQLMNGHKWELFVLDLSFIGWILLAILTLGIGILWLEPYMQVSHAKFYERLVGNANENVSREEPKFEPAENEGVDTNRDLGNAEVVYRLKCSKCGAKETHTEKSMECPYCGGKMTEE